MNSKKYLFVLIIFVFAFFGWNDKAMALTPGDTRTCSYAGTLSFVNGSTLPTGAPLTITRTVRADGTVSDTLSNTVNEVTIVDGEKGPNAEPTIECPLYLVYFTEAVNPNHVYNSFYKEIETKEEIQANGNKYYYYYIGDMKMQVETMHKYNGESASNNGNSYECKYDLYLFENGAWNPTPRYINVNAKIQYEQKTADGNMDLTKATITLNGGDNYRNGETHNIGGKDDSFGGGNLRPNECPYYIVPTSAGLGSSWYDIYPESNGDAAVQEKASQADAWDKRYYKITADSIKQNEQNATIEKVDCYYYNLDNYLKVEVVKGFETEQYYDVRISYFVGLNNKVGETYIAAPYSDNTVLENIIDAKSCSAYKYTKFGVDVKGLKTGAKIKFDFFDKEVDPSEAYSYFALAITNEEASRYKLEMDYAESVIFQVVNLMQLNMDATTRKLAIENVIRKSIEKHNASGLNTSQLDDVLSYIQNGGQPAKAIADYANYWYATASTYARAFVIDEACTAGCTSYDSASGDCSLCLRGQAESFKKYIETSMKNGYIPLPSGCAMLSNDLIKFLGWILRLVRYAAIVIAILLGMVDFFRAISESDDKAFQKAGGRFLKRIIAVVFIFISAIFIQFILYNYALPGIGEEEINLCNITTQE